jgi:enoyl-CoA hydratase
MSGDIQLSYQGAVATLRLVNSAKANAIDTAMLDALDVALSSLEATGNTRVLLLRGTPGAVFSSGADVGAWGPMSPDDFAEQWIARGNALFDRLERLPLVCVAVIEGACHGGGFELALCADLRVGSDAANLRVPELTIGAIPGWQGATRLAKITGRGRSLEMMFCARRLDAATALAWGVLNQVWPADRLEAELASLCTQLAAMSPQASAIAKRAFHEFDASSKTSADAYTEAARRCKASSDAAEGLAAFRAKRPAQF